MAKKRKHAKPRAWRKSEMGLWQEAANPLRGLTLARAMQIYDFARRGNYADLHWLYNEIEAADPTLMICRDRRESALVELDWTVTKKRAGRIGARRWDETLADEQQAFLEEAYGACDNFEAGCEHLMGAFFRGYAHTRPIYSDNGQALIAFENLDGWNFVRDLGSGAWYWNPDAASAVTPSSLDEVPGTELVVLQRSRHIDYPAFSIYIRAALGERLWGEFVERYGVPPVMVVMPEFADKTEENRYLKAAELLCEGGSGALPFGSEVHYAGESRGADPFTAFLKHQQELVVLMATGGLLTSLTGATGIGQGASDAHTKTWDTVVRRDARMVAAALEARVTRDLLAAAYPERPQLVEFSFETEAEPTADAIFDTATKARASGYRIERADLEERTGYRLIEEQNPAFGGFGSPVLNKADATPLQNVANPLQNASKQNYVPTGTETDPALETLLHAFKADMSPVAEKVAALLDLPESERATAAASLAAALPTLLPDDPEMVAVLEGALAEAFVEEIEAVGSPVSNAGTSEGARKGWETRRRNGWTPEQLKENKQKVGDLAKEALADKQSNRTVNLGKIEGKVIEDIKAVTGIDVSGYEQTISSRDIRHTDTGHGPIRRKGGRTIGETAPDQVPIVEKDFRQVPDLYSSYDRITRGSPERGTNNPTIRYHKKDSDGTLVGVEVVVTKEKTLKFKTAWRKAP